jgi:hypothetical protein
LEWISSGDVVQGWIYAVVDNEQEEYKSSLIQARGNISSQSFIFLIDILSTHSFISLTVVANFKIHSEKLQDPWKVQMDNGAKKWINMEVDGCVVDLGEWSSEVFFHELALGAYDRII